MQLGIILSWKPAGLYPYYWSPGFGFPSEQARSGQYLPKFLRRDRIYLCFPVVHPRIQAATSVLSIYRATISKGEGHSQAVIGRSVFCDEGKSTGLTAVQALCIFKR